MPDLSITITGVPQLVAKLGKAVAAQTLEKAMSRAQARIQSALAKYPSPPSGSQYVRTGDLGRSWTSSRPVFSSGSISGTVGNAVRSRRGGQKYAKWVQSGETQTGQHSSTGWLTDQKALDQNKSAIEGIFGSAIDSALS